jgi:hypothetical protein
MFQIYRLNKMFGHLEPMNNHIFFKYDEALAEIKMIEGADAVEKGLRITKNIQAENKDFDYAIVELNLLKKSLTLIKTDAEETI